jgi:PAS domain S-box-containing protein
LLVTVCGFLFHSAYTDVKGRAIDRLNAEQLIFAEQASKNIKSIFERYLHILEYLSSSPHIVVLDDQGKEIMTSFYEAHKDEIQSITLLDKNGQCIYSTPYNASIQGADLSNQEHIQEVIRNHHPILSDVFRTVQGFNSIAFHIPIFLDEVFHGSLGILISFDHLASESLEDIKIGEDGYASMISRKGVELYCPVPGHTGHSVFENCKDFPDILSMAREMVEGRAGTTTYVFDKVRGQTIESIKKHAVYLPIALPGTFWSIVVATPESEVTGSISGFRDRWLLIIGILLLAVAFCSYYFGRALIIVREDAKHKRAEEALRLSEKQLRRAEVVAAFGNWEFILDRDEVKASEGARLIYGLGDEHWSIREVQTIPLPEYRAMLDEALRGLIEEGRPYNVEFKIRRPTDGAVRDIHAIAEYSPGERLVFGVIQDITARKNAETALAEEALWRRTLFEQSKDGIVVLDRKGKVYEANQRYADMLGYSSEEVHELHVWDWDAQWTREELEGRIESIDVAGDNFETRHRRKDGTICDVEISTNAMVRGSKKLVFCVCRDVTWRNEANEALRNSERQLRGERALLRALIDSIPDLIFFKDRNSVFLGCNKAFAVYSGVPESDLIGKTDLHFAPQEVAELYRRKDKEMFASGSPQRNEEWIPFKNGGGGYFDTLKTPYYGPDGELLGLIGVSRDISEQKRMAEAMEKRLIALTRPLGSVENIEFEDLFDLKEIQKLQDQFAHAARVSSIITHVDGSPITAPSNFCRLCRDVVRQTPTGLKNCRYSDSVIGRRRLDGPVIQQCLGAGLWSAGASISVGGRHIANWIIGQVRDETQDEEAMRAYAGEIGIDEKSFMAAFREVPTMSREQFERVAQALSTLAEQLSSMAYQNIQQGRFITELKRSDEEKRRLEDQLMHAQKLESVGRLAGGVAHDFNNMLGVIIGHTELALHLGESSESLRQSLQEILKAANRSADLTRQLLAFARKQTVSPKVLDLNDTIAGMLKMLRRLIGEDIELIWIPGHELWSVKIDPSQIDQMLANLAVNARDAIAGVGKVTIETANVSLDEFYCAGHPECAPGDYVQLVLSDTGSGMSKEVIDHIFEPFFTTKGVGQGTGLGLATVYGIVRQNEGFVNVYSEPGRGATFKIYLRRFGGDTVAVASETMAEKPPCGTETVLVVEDEEAILSICRNILHQLGYTVLIAHSPTEAIRLADEHAGSIHLLITDVVMPEMNGRDLAERLSASNPDLKCLFMSGYTASIIAQHNVLEEGMHFIQKPFTVRALAEKTRETLDDRVS